MRKLAAKFSLLKKNALFRASQRTRKLRLRRRQSFRSQHVILDEHAIRRVCCGELQKCKKEISWRKVNALFVAQKQVR
jgi:hypothetical protein